MLNNILLFISGVVVIGFLCVRSVERREFQAQESTQSVETSCRLEIWGEALLVGSEFSNNLQAVPSISCLTSIIML